MVIQGTQVPMYTKHTLFLYFFYFSIFFIYEKQNKAKLRINKQKHVKQSKALNQMQIDESMIPKADKKSRKKVLLQIERIKVNDNKKDN